jgi:uncharacterized protein
MSAYFTPGVWFETLDSGAQRIDPLRTDIAAFIGVAEKGPLHRPVRVHSIEQFRSAFGVPMPNALLAYAVKAYFENGGRTCDVIRVAAPLVETGAAGAQDPARLESAVTSTTGFAGGAAVTITQTIDTVAAGAQPADRASSVLASVAGFASGALVRVMQAARPVTYRRVADVDTATAAILWDAPLDAAYNLALPILFRTVLRFERLLSDVAAGTLRWTRPLEDALVLTEPIHFATGAAKASFTLLDDTAQPTLTVTASSEGAWGNRLAIQAVRTSRHATRFAGTQPVDRKSSLVESVVGFTQGTVVRLFHDGLASEVHAVIASVDAAEGRIVWTALLDGALDLTKPVSIESAELALSVYEDGRIRETFEDLSLVAEHKGYAPRFVNATSALIHLELEPSPAAPPHNLPDPQSPALTRGRALLAGGRDGIAALAAKDVTGDRASEERRGLRTLELIGDVSAIAAPDLFVERVPAVELVPVPKPEPDPCDPCAAVPPLVADPPLPKIEEQSATFTLEQAWLVQRAIVEHCERLKDRIALLDPPNFTAAQRAEIESWRRRFDSSYAALYYPWVVVVDPAARGASVVRAIPPSGHVLGIYARSDRHTGVHKAPANEALEWAQDLSIDVSPEWQAMLNPIGVNAIRPFAGRGLRVYGARTVSSDPSWRFVNVRRLMIMIERAIGKSLQWAVFEPNDAHLRDKIAIAIAGFLDHLWRQGALAGATAEESYYVLCGDTNNPPAEQAEGRLLAEVGVAPAIPAEFVVLRIGRVEDVLEVVEAEGAAAWR